MRTWSRRYRRYPIDDVRHSPDTDALYGCWQRRMSKPGKRRFTMVLTTKIADAPLAVGSLQVDANRDAVERLQVAITCAGGGRRARVHNAGHWLEEKAVAARRVRAMTFPGVGPRLIGQPVCNDPSGTISELVTVCCHATIS